MCLTWPRIANLRIFSINRGSKLYWAPEDVIVWVYGMPHPCEQGLTNFSLGEGSKNKAYTYCLVCTSKQIIKTDYFFVIKNIIFTRVASSLVDEQVNCNIETRSCKQNWKLTTKANSLTTKTKISKLEFMQYLRGIVWTLVTHLKTR